MSTTASAIDAKGFLIGWLHGLTSMTTADIKAMPEDKWSATFGGCTRSAQQVVAETINMLNWTTEALKGNVIETMGEEDLPPIEAMCDTREKAIAALGEASSNMATALAAASDEALLAEVMPPWKMPAPLFMLANIAVSHIWYHDGQINYMQCLLGDDKVHWMG